MELIGIEKISLSIYYKAIHYHASTSNWTHRKPEQIEILKYAYRSIELTQGELSTATN